MKCLLDVNMSCPFAVSRMPTPQIQVFALDYCAHCR